MRLFGRVAAIATLSVLLAAYAGANEMKSLLSRLVAVRLTPAKGFAVRMLVPPGQLYDPLVMHPHGDDVWLNDDGKQEGEHGSRLIAVNAAGHVSVLVDADKLAPISAGFDIAPDSFGAYGGQVFALSQVTTGDKAGAQNYIVQRIDPRKGFAVSVFCTLPAQGGKASGVGVDATFSPTGSPFGGKLYATSSVNNTIYAITPDGRAEPFVTFDANRYGAPLYMRFAPDGNSLLVAVVRGGIFAPRGSAIIRVMPDGKVSGTPLAESPNLFGSFDYAPAGFGPYAGQLFVTDVGYYEIPVPLAEPLRPDGKVYRVSPSGKFELVASGFVNPWDLRFIKQSLWVSDVNGDFIYGHREIPDGFIAEITLQ
ncbi:MAG TPA: hypothetical protein VMT61_06895 [Candidatus Binataceae bacterium]|nr:hypothetical protein [Candidatus Binataceae bacterium]